MPVPRVPPVGSSGGIIKFRHSFKLSGGKELLHWFPFHMQHGLKKMQSKLANVDAVIEVHDARIPFSGRSTLLEQSVRGGARPHVLVLNKADLTDLTSQHHVLDKLTRQGDTNVMFATCNKHTSKSVRELVPRLVELINSSDRYHRLAADVYRVMVVGVPNTGKSTLINSLRLLHLNKAEALKVSDVPGVTRHVMERVKICDAPSVYLLDTPGIYEPRVKSIEVGMRLAMCNILSDSQIGAHNLADYALYIMNRYEYFDYVDVLGLKEPCDDILEVLYAVAAINGWTSTVKNQSAIGPPEEVVLNISRSATHIVNMFRKGKFGKMCLDLDCVDSYYSKRQGDKRLRGVDADTWKQDGA